MFSMDRCGVDGEIFEKLAPRRNEQEIFEAQSNREMLLRCLKLIQFIRSVRFVESQLLNSTLLLSCLVADDTTLIVINSPFVGLFQVQKYIHHIVFVVRFVVLSVVRASFEQIQPLLSQSPSSD